MPSTVRQLQIEDFKDAIDDQLLHSRAQGGKKPCKTIWKQQQDKGESLIAKAMNSRYLKSFGSGVFKILEKGKESGIGKLDHDAKLLYTLPGKNKLCLEVK